MNEKDAFLVVFSVMFATRKANAASISNSNGLEFRLRPPTGWKIINPFHIFDKMFHISDKMFHIANKMFHISDKMF